MLQKCALTVDFHSTSNMATASWQQARRRKQLKARKLRVAKSQHSTHKLCRATFYSRLKRRFHHTTIASVLSLGSLNAYSTAKVNSPSSRG